MKWTTFFVKADGSTRQLNSDSRWRLGHERSRAIKELMKKHEKIIYVSPIRPEGFKFHLPAAMVFIPKKVKS